MYLLQVCAIGIFVPCKEIVYIVVGLGHCQYLNEMTLPIKYGKPTGGIIFGYTIAMLLLGAAFVAIGVFVSSLTENQLRIVSVMDHPGMHVDDIIDLTQLSASVVLSELTILQIRGFVSQEQGKRFSLNITK